MSIAGRTFTVQVTDQSEAVSRASRRVIISADVLKSAKLLAGDTVVLSQTDSAAGQHRVSADFEGCISYLSILLAPTNEEVL